MRITKGRRARISLVGHAGYKTYRLMAISLFVLLAYFDPVFASKLLMNLVSLLSVLKGF
jgi:hypothetical protein